MYGLTDDRVQKVSQHFPVAVDNLCRLEKCEYTTKGSNELEAIDFVYVMEKSDMTYRITDTRFAVNPSSINVKDGETHQEALERAHKALNTVLKHVATKFNCTEAEMTNLNVSSFKTFANDYCKMIMTKVASNNPSLYCKTYKDPNGYSKVGKYVPFLQRADAGPCELTWTSAESKLNHAAGVNGVIKSDETIENYV